MEAIEPRIDVVWRLIYFTSMSNLQIDCDGGISFVLRFSGQCSKTNAVDAIGIGWLANVCLRRGTLLPRQRNFCFLYLFYFSAPSPSGLTRLQLVGTRLIEPADLFPINLIKLHLRNGVDNTNILLCVTVAAADVAAVVFFGRFISPPSIRFGFFVGDFSDAGCCWRKAWSDRDRLRLTALMERRVTRKSITTVTMALSSERLLNHVNSLGISNG